MDALTIATIGLVIATVVLAWVTWQAREEARRQTAVFERQTTLIEQQARRADLSIEYSRKVVEEMQAERAERNPLALRPRLDGSKPTGEGKIGFTNAREYGAIRVIGVHLFGTPAGQIVNEPNVLLAPGEAWQMDAEFDPTGAGGDIRMVVVGQPVGGPVQHAELFFRPSANGVLVPLDVPVRRPTKFYSF